MRGGGGYHKGSVYHQLTSNDANGIIEEWTRGRGAAGQDNDVLWQQSVYGYNDAAVPEKIEYMRLVTSIFDASDGTEDATFLISRQVAGTLQNALKLSPTEIDIFGAANVGSNMRFLLYGDSYPVVHFLNFSHLNCQWMFDSYYDGTYTRASIAGNHIIRMVKGSSQWYITGAPSPGLNGAITSFTNIATFEAVGTVGVGVVPGAVSGKFHVYDNTAGASNPVLLLHQDHASSTGILVKGVHDGTGLIHRWERGITADATGGISQFYRSRGASAGVAADVLWEMQFKGLDAKATPEETQYAGIVAGIVDPTDTSEDGYLSLKTMLGGALTEGLYIGGDGWGLKGHTSKTLSTGWAVANLTSDKTLDCNANDDLQTADVLGTLITELIAKGVIAA